MSERTYKITKSIAIPLSAEAEPKPDSPVMVLVYSYYTSKGRKATAEAKAAERVSDYRVDGAIMTREDFNCIATDFPEDKMPEPWLWIDGNTERRFIYSDAFSTRRQAEKWWAQRKAKIVNLSWEDFTKDALMPDRDKVVVGKMYWPTVGYAALADGSSFDGKIQEQTVLAKLAVAGKPFLFALSSTKPLSRVKLDPKQMKPLT